MNKVTITAICGHKKRTIKFNEASKVIATQLCNDHIFDKMHVCGWKVSKWVVELFDTETKTVSGWEYIPTYRD